MENTPSLEAALREIRRVLPPLSSEKVQISRALGRICSAPLYASESCPSFSQSTRDGYALDRMFFKKIGDDLEYLLDDEIAAGDLLQRRSRAGFAHRIMTGAAVPRGAWKVVPQEFCREEHGRVFVSEPAVQRDFSYIQKKGSLLRPGALLLEKGACLEPAHLARLADSGCAALQVYRRPEVSFFCSGSELVDDPARRSRGQKISSNRYLLAGLIRGFGGRGFDCGTVGDQREALADHLAATAEGRSDIIISTGGMGPGRYDLIEEIFTRVGGRIIFNSVKLRPGKAVLFGTLGGSLYFGLPGPPQAVQALFYVLIRPALLAMQGLAPWKASVRARLTEEIITGKPGVLKLIEAVITQRNGVAEVRPAGGKDTADCYLFFPAARKRLNREELVKVQPLAPPPFLFMP